MPADLINNLVGYWKFEDGSTGFGHNEFNIIETEWNPGVVRSLDSWSTYEK